MYPAQSAIFTYETNVSAVQNPPQTASRFPKTEFDEKWQGDVAEPPSSGAQAFDASLSGAMTAPKNGLGLPRSARVKQRRDFDLVRAKGRRLTCGCLIANWMALPTDARSRLGVITSRRVGPATIRNRARRLLRESFRRHQHELSAPATIVLVARSSIVGKPFRVVERDYLTALRRAGLLGAS
jgi:ribonuclease P protein component